MCNLRGLSEKFSVTIKKRIYNFKIIFFSISPLRLIHLFQRDVKNKSEQSHGPAGAYALLSRLENTEWVFQKSKVRGKFGNMREDVTVGWRQFHSEKLDNLYCSLHIAVTSRCS
jgi:hypothetical protein